MVEGQKDHSNQARSHEVHSFQEKVCGILLDGDDVEESVDELRSVDAIERLRTNPGKPECQLTGRSDEDSPLDDFGDVVLEGQNECLQNKANSKDLGNDDESLNVGVRLSAEGKIGHDGINREWQGEIEDTGKERKDEQGDDVLSFGLEDPEKALERGDMAFVVMIIMAMGGGSMPKELFAHSSGGRCARSFGGGL